MEPIDVKQPDRASVQGLSCFPRRRNHWNDPIGHAVLSKIYPEGVERAEPHDLLLLEIPRVARVRIDRVDSLPTYGLGSLGEDDRGPAPGGTDLHDGSSAGAALGEREQQPGVGAGQPASY